MPGPRLVRLVGVYDADGSLRGELAYWVGARLGRAHCSLCGITHGMFKVKSEFEACRLGLPVPFDTFHRDDAPAAVLAAASRLPVVVAEVADGPIVPLVDAAALDGLAGSVDGLMAAIEAAVTAAGIEWPA